MLRPLAFAVLLLSVPALSGCRGEAPPPPAMPEPVPPAPDVARPPQAVAGAWVSPGPQGGTTALYMTLTGGSVPDTLVSVAYPGAQVAEIHESYETADGMRGMRALRTLPLAAADTVHLEPGGLHLMLVSLYEALAPGDTVRVDLRFARGGTVHVEALVRAPQ